MDSFFSKKRTRPRQPSVSQDLVDSAVPYNKLAPPQRSPLQAGNMSQGIRGPAAPVISAPMTNPTLTANGTELNKFALAKQRQEREQAYRDASPNRRPGSPTASVSTADSSSLFNDGESSRSRASTRRNRSESSYTMTEATTVSPTSPASVTKSLTGEQGSSRPGSTYTYAGDDRRSSRYAPTLGTTDSRHSHLSSISSHLSRYGPSEEFTFPRPSDEEIDAFFENIRQSRGLGGISLSMDQKWAIVHSDEQVKWKEEKEQVKKLSETRAPLSLIERSPEWYLKKFLENTITVKEAAGLQVSLRSKEVRYDPWTAQSYWLVDVSSTAGLQSSLNCAGRLCWPRPLAILVERLCNGKTPQYITSVAGR